MAEKGFDVKVLIPTEDGVTISKNKLDEVQYYLMYNISNRSYQLAGTIKVTDLLAEGKFQDNLAQLITEEKLDIVISKSDISKIGIKKRIPKHDDIGDELNFLIDIIDQKKELI